MYPELGGVPISLWNPFKQVSWQFPEFERAPHAGAALMGAPLGLLQAARFCLGLRRFALQSGRRHVFLWVVVKELTFSYYMGKSY